jgi:hypothetical protein
MIPYKSIFRELQFIFVHEGKGQFSVLVSDKQILNTVSLTIVMSFTVSRIAPSP